MLDKNYGLFFIKIIVIYVNEIKFSSVKILEGR